jgi:hypothetical protein
MCLRMMGRRDEGPTGGEGPIRTGEPRTPARSVQTHLNDEEAAGEVDPACTSSGGGPRRRAPHDLCGAPRRRHWVSAGPSAGPLLPSTAPVKYPADLSRA